MSSDAIALWTELSSDPELIAGVRAGDTAAFGVLYERHVDAARKVAAVYTNAAADVDDVVSESFSRVLRALQRGDGPDLAFRAYLFTIVRRTGLDLIDRGIRTKPRDDMGEYESSLGYGPSSDEPAIAGFEHGMVADAFKSLPERWQAVLWYTEVEKKSPREIAPLLGLSANGVAALSYRAREALRQAYLQQHLNVADTVNCLEANTQLGAYVRGGLSKREHSAVDTHIKSCERCAGLVAELEDVNRGMRGIIAPLVLGAAGMGALEGGLPIGGAFAPQPTAAGSAGAAGVGGAGGAGGTGVGAGVHSTVGAGAVAGSGGGTAGAAAAGVGGAGAVAVGSGGIASTIAGFAGLVVPTVAVVAVVAVVVNSAAIIGLVDGPTSQLGGQSVPGAAEAKGLTGDDAVGDGDTLLPETTPSPSPESPPADDDAASANPGASSPSDRNRDNEQDQGREGSSQGSPGSTTNPDPDPAPTTDSSPPDNDPAPPSRSPLLQFVSVPLDYLEVSRLAPNVGMTVENSGDGDAENVIAGIVLPEGLAFAPPSGGASATSVVRHARLDAFVEFATEGTFTSDGWTCELFDDGQRSACSLDQLGSGDEASLLLDLDITGDVADDAVTTFSVNYGEVAENYSVRTGIEEEDDELNVRYAASGSVAAIQVGAPLMSCGLEDSQCRNAMSFSANSTSSQYNNNYWNMVPLNEYEGDGTSNSAATYLALPEGSEVLYASLEWSANRDNDHDEFDAEPAAARLLVPGGGDFIDITADSTRYSFDDGEVREYYQSRVDITDLVQEHGGGGGEWMLADIALTDGNDAADPSYYGGFGITVIYEHTDLPDSRVALFDGSRWVRTGDTTEFAFVTDDPAEVTVGWIAWEADRGIGGDRVDINGDELKPQRSNPGGNWPDTFAEPSNGAPDNAADATAFGSKYANSLGVDAKPFGKKSVDEGTHTLTALTDGDQYLISAVTVTIAYAD